LDLLDKQQIIVLVIFN